MKAARLTAPFQIEVVDLPSPVVGPGEVRVRVAKVGICGSDINRFRGTAAWGTLPNVPGHECTGTVIEVDASAQASPGQRVALNPMVVCGRCPACLRGHPNHCSELQVLGAHRPGCYAEEVVVPASTIRPLPPGMPFDQGVMVEPTAVAVHCANRGAIHPGDRVAVLGAGAIGLLLQQVAKAKGAGYVFATGRVDTKLALARSLGADETANATKEDVLTPARRQAFDLTFDLVGAQDTLDQAIMLTRPGGRIVLIAAPHGTNPVLNYAEVYRKELSVNASRLYDADFDEALPLIHSGKVRVEPIVSHRFPLARAAEALRTVMEQRASVTKAILEP